MSAPNAPANAGQLEYWNGAAGRRWAREQARLDRAFAPLTAALLAQAGLRPGERVLDIGCGNGDLALAAAHAIGPAGHVTGLDISRAMLEVARAREAAMTKPHAPVTWLEADAASTSFDPVTDCVMSRFGTMFFSHPITAFANIRTALKPGGRLAMLCWREPAANPWAAVPEAAIVPIMDVPAPSPPGAPGPFAFADAEGVRSLLGAAGFEGASARPVDAAMVVGASGSAVSALEDAVDYCLGIGPGAALLRGADDAQKEKARAALEAALAPYLDGDAVRLGAACWIYEAVNPS
jgi:SAM-dependent methyltransferase